MKRRILLGTDWWTDCDDCVAVRLLCNAHKKGEIELCGVVLNACMEESAPSLNAFLTHEGLGDLPIGIDLAGTDFAGDWLRYQKPLCAYPHRIQRNEDCPDGIALYRKLLTESDSKTDIVEIGFYQVLAGLLLSPGGTQLVREKVGHVYAMAGKWDEDGGREHNFCNNSRSRQAAHTLCTLCPVPITFLGFEAGESVRSGDGLPQDDPLSVAMRAHGHEHGRSSWDPMTALLAVIGDAEQAGYDVVRGTARVDADTGANHFAPEPDGLHAYVVKKKPDEYYRAQIQKRI